MSSQAYTPSLKLKEYYTLIKTRKLPLKGEVLCKKRDKVSHNTIVARTSIPGAMHIINVCYDLSVDPEEVKKYMLIKEGDTIKKGEPLAHYSYFFGIFKQTCYSTITGILELCSSVTGQAIMREMPIPLNLTAYIPGTVKEVLINEGVEIEITATYIQGTFGIGGERHGNIKIMTKKLDDIVLHNQIGPECEGKVLIFGSIIEYETLKKAIEVGASGIVSGGIKGESLKNLLGTDLGVVITGQEEVGITLIITEGFGNMSMRKKTFDLFRKNEGNLACINGATQIRAGVVRPEIIIPLAEDTFDKTSRLESEDTYIEGLKPGTWIRIVREPFFGALGNVVDLPVELYKLESESEVRILIIKLEDGRKVIVPRANVEIIEE